MLRVDKQQTEEMSFNDKRSYVGNRMHPGTEHQCVYLKGRDRSVRRAVIFSRSKGLCELCGDFCPFTGEMHHVKGGLGAQRCDCAENLVWACRECHRQAHGRYPRFGETLGDA